MEDKTWIKLYRKAKNNDIMRDPTAWLIFSWILLSVDKNTGKWKTGRFLLSNLTDIKPPTVRDAIYRLERKYGVLTTDTTTRRYTEITLLHWDKYQNKNDTTTTRRQLDDNSTTLNKNKELRNKNKEIYKEKKYGTIETITAEDIKEISEEYGITVQKVRFVFEQLKLYDKKVYKNYKLALKKWIVRDLGVDGLAKARAEKNKPQIEIPEALLTDEQRAFNLQKLRQLKIQHGLIINDSEITQSNK